MGPSGVGKDTVLAEMNKLNEPPYFHHNKSWTTRKPRPNEPPDIYNFVDKTEFEQADAAGLFLQTNKEIYGNWYATPLPHVLPDDTVELFILLADSAVKVKNYFPKTKIYLIEPPSMRELRLRLEARSVYDPDDLDKREQAAEIELRDGRAIADYSLVNETGKQRETAQRLHEKIRADWKAAQAAG
jgi:guanylate kinase